MKKLLLLLSSAVIFYNSTQAQPVVPSTSPYTRTLLPLQTQGAWDTALGISGGGGGGTSNLVTVVPFAFYTNITTNVLITNTTGYPEVVSINLGQIGTIATPGYGQITISSGGPGTPTQIANYNTNQVASVMTAMVPSGANWFLSYLTVGGATVSQMNAFIYGLQAQTNTIGSGGGSSTNGIYNMSGGNGAFQDMSNAPATYQGETGRSLGGVGSVYYFNAAGAGTGSMVWGGYANWPGGVGEIGDQLIDLTNTAFNAPTGNGVTTGGNLNINFRGGPNGTRETNVWNGSTTVDSYMFVNNMNPFDSGASFGVRSADTNLSAIGASPLLTNVDGVVIGLPQFGFDMIDIPFSYPIGLNNQAGSDVLIFAKPFMGVSMNITFSSNGTSYPGQYSAFLIDNRYQSNSSFPLMVDFPVLNGEGGTYLPVQSLWQNAFAVDEINNITYASTNTTNGVFNANLGNLNKLNVGQFAIHGVPQTATNHFLINSTNGGEFDTAGNYPALWTFDYSGDSGAQRLGVGVTTAYPNWVYAKGAEFDIQQASISDLSTGIGGATFTNEFHLKNGVVTLTGGITTQGTATGTITATGWTNTTGTNCYVSAIGAVSIVIHDNAGTAWATNTGLSTGEIIPLQAGGSITASSGLTGTWHVQ